MALGETIVAATAGLTGAAIGAWATSRAAVMSARRTEVIAARAELASVYELIWAEHLERRTRMAVLKYRLAYLNVPANDISSFIAAFTECEAEAQEVYWAVRDGELSDDEAGISNELIENVIVAADRIAFGLR